MGDKVEKNGCTPQQVAVKLRRKADIMEGRGRDEEMRNWKWGVRGLSGLSCMF